MGREEGGGSGWGTHVYLWRIHFDIWQNQFNIVKFNPESVTFPTGFTSGPQQLLGDPFQGMRKPMSPVTAQVWLSFSQTCLLSTLVVACGIQN